MDSYKPIVLITGSTKGIGRGLALHLAKSEKYRVVVNGREQSSVDDVVQSINEEVGDGVAWGVATDIGSEEQVKDMFASMVRQVGAPDVVINNAAFAGTSKQKLHEMESLEWQQVMQCNLDGTYLCYKYAVRCMLEHNVSGGKIINISSGITRSFGTPPMLQQYGAYALSKHGVEQLTKLAAQEVFGHSIGVGCISIDGSYQSEMTRGIFSEKQFERLPPVSRVFPLFRRLLDGSWEHLSGKVFSTQRYQLDPEMEWLTASPASEVELYRFGMPILERKKFLCSGESHVGPSPEVQKFLQSDTVALQQYPRTHAILELKREIARHLGLASEEMVFIGNGIVSCLDSILQVFVGPGHHVLSHTMGWAFCGSLIQARGAYFSEVELKLNGSHCDFQMEEMARQVKASTRLVYLTNPNNPAGRLIDEDSLNTFLDTIPDNIPVVIDECYADYVGREYACHVPSLLAQRDRPIIGLRSFSKFHGLANMRIGYAIANPLVIRAIERYHLPWTVSDINARCATLALRDLNYQQQRREEVAKERNFLQHELENLGVGFVPSDSMSLLIEIPQDGFYALRSRLDRNEIVITPYLYKNHFLYQIGKRYHNEKLLETLASFAGNNGAVEA